jgi:hypothetical protein
MGRDDGILAMRLRHGVTKVRRADRPLDWFPEGGESNLTELHLPNTEAELCEK